MRVKNRLLVVRDSVLEPHTGLACARLTTQILNQIFEKESGLALTVLNPPKPFSIYSMSANFAERLPKVHVTNSREKRKIDSLSGLCSTIKVTESLEVAYARSAISADEYEKECKKIHVYA